MSSEELFKVAHNILYKKALKKPIDLSEDYEEITMKIGDFIDYNEIKELDNPSEIKEDFYIETPSGLSRINSGIKKDKHDIINVTFSNGLSQKVAEKHIYPQYDGANRYAVDATHVITKKGKVFIDSKEYYSNDYVYDIGIDNPYLYYTADGILSHNSALLANISSNMVLKGSNVLYITLEMTEKKTAQRIDANILDISMNDFRTCEPQVIRDIFNGIKDSLGRLFIKEYPSGKFDTLDLEVLVEEFKAKGIEFDVIVIDYLGIMSSSRTTLKASGGSYHYIKTIAEECHSFAKKYKIPVLSAAQLNRCLTPNSKVTLLKDNKEIETELKDIKIGDMIKGSKGFVEVLRISKSKGKTYEKGTELGEKIECSENHRFPTKNGLLSIKDNLKIGEILSNKL